MVRLPESRWARWGIVIGLTAVLLGIAGAAAAWRAFRAVPEVEFDADEARELIETVDHEAVEPDFDRLSAYEELDPTRLGEVLAEAEAQGRLLGAGFTSPNARSPFLPDDMFESYLLIGSDASGALADVIIYVLEPSDGADPMIVSIPRDLYLRSPCTQQSARINANLNGCNGLINGPTLLSLAVADFTGVEVDHFVLVDFDGFAAIVDALGGVELCFDHPTRDRKSDLNVSTGCMVADGATTLAWVRSRHTQQFVGGAWRSVGADDFTRQDKQQDVLFDLFGRLSSFRSLSTFTSFASSMSSAVALDSGWSFPEAVRLAWEHRSITSRDVRRIYLETDDYRTADGAAVLVPTRSFYEILVEVYPPAAD